MVAPAEREPNVALLPLTDYPIMADISVVTVRNETLYDCYVPTSLIDIHDVPVDHDKLEFLRKDFKKHQEEHGGTGQRAAVRLAYIPGNMLFSPFDGYHRLTVMAEIGEPLVFATAEVMQQEQFVDERIRNSFMHDNIKTARTAIWLQEAWSYFEPFNEKVGIVQAAAIASQGTSGGRMGLTAEERNACVAWIEVKAQLWGTTLSSLHKLLRDAEALDPSLVRNIRKSSKSALPGEVSITPSAASKIAEHLGGKSNGTIQRLVAQAAVDHKLKTAQVAQLALEIQGMTIEEAKTYVASRSFDANNTGQERRSAFGLVSFTGGTACKTLLDV